MAYVAGPPRAARPRDVPLRARRAAGRHRGPPRPHPGLDETFLVCNGDLLTGLDFADLVAHHRARGAALTVAVHRKPVKLSSACSTSTPSGACGVHREARDALRRVDGRVRLRASALAYIRPGEYLDFPRPRAAAARRGREVAAYRTDAYWLDIGNPEDYARAQEDAAEGRGPAAQDGAR
jgi:NDP-sugar pyrophosphorylase family protein